MSKKLKELAARYGRKADLLDEVKEIIEEQYHVSAFYNPDYPIITAGEQIRAYKWGLIPYWLKPRKNTDEERQSVLNEAEKIRKMTYNARAETVFRLPSYSLPVRKQRCLIPSTGYFEYHHNEDKTKTPYFIFLKNEEIFSMAGIYDVWHNPLNGEDLFTFSMITSNANPLTAWIHNNPKNPYRMPVLLKKADEEKWLDPTLSETGIKSLLKPFPEKQMDAYAVGKDFFRKNPHDPSIIERAS